MRLLHIMNRYREDWRNILESPPYNLIIKTDGDYVLMKYNNFESDFSKQEVCEARGSIFYYNKGKDAWECVCRPFYKFFNYGEEYAAEIDWSSATVTEKVDGSLMKLWWHKGAWHLSTNGTIDAFKAYPNGFDVSFGELFERACGLSIYEVGETFGVQGFTHLFELTVQEDRKVIPYEEGVWYLTSFDSMGREHWIMPHCNIKVPSYFALDNLEDVINVVEGFDKLEGVVVQDNKGNRIKVKSPSYFMKHGLYNNGVVTVKRVLKMRQANFLDDFLAYSPYNKDFVLEVLNKINKLEAKLESDYLYMKNLQVSGRAEYARHAKQLTVPDWLFKKYDNELLTAKEYLNSLHLSDLAQYLDKVEV